MKKRIVCAMLAAMMVFSATTPTWAADEAVEGASVSKGTITTETEKKDPVYKVSVPTNVKVYIDPFQQLKAASVTSEDFAFINKSNVAIKLDATISLTAGDGVTFVTSDTGIDSDTTKKAMVQVEIPTAITETPETGSKFVATEDWTTPLTVYKATGIESSPSGGLTAITNKADYYITKNNDTLVTGEAEVTTEMQDVRKAEGVYTTTGQLVTLDSTKETTLSFALKEAKYVDIYETCDKDTSEVKYNVFQTTNTGNTSSAVFRFSGKVNQKADWQSSDIKTKVTYSFIGLNGTDYNAALNKNTESTKGHAYSEKSETTSAAPSIATTAYDLEAGKELKVTVDYGTGSLSANNITKIVNKLTGADVPAARYSVSGNVITFDSTFTQNNASSATSGLKFDVVFNNDAKTTVEITVTTKQ